jgi:hypothetical protein
MIGRPGGRREPRASGIEFASPQRVEKGRREHHTLALATSETLVKKILYSSIQCFPDLPAESSRAERDGLAPDKLAIKPGGSLSGDLCLDRQVRTDRERNAPSTVLGPWISGAADAQITGDRPTEQRTPAPQVRQTSPPEPLFWVGPPCAGRLCDRTLDPRPGCALNVVEHFTATPTVAAHDIPVALATELIEVLTRHHTDRRRGQSA